MILFKRSFLILWMNFLLAFVVAAEEGKTSSNHTDTLVILTFNDFHGAFAPDGNTVPGAARLTQAMLDEKEKYPHAIVVSGGDNFSGTYFSKITRGEPLREMFERMEVELSAVGNHEFDWGLPYLVDTAMQDIPYVSANVLKEKTYTPLIWLPPYRIVERELKDGSLLRVAFIGLTTTETYFKTSPKLIEGLQFTHPLGAACIQTTYELKKEGKIDLIILLAHIGTDMKVPERIMEENALGLPYINGIDAIITAHSHEVVLDTVNNIPIIQAGSNGEYIGNLLFQIQDQNGKREVTFLRGDTIPVSPQRAEDMEMKQDVQRIMDTYHLSERLAVAKESLPHNITSNRFKYTPIGALVTDAYAHAFRERMSGYADQIVIGVNHYGGIRTSLPAGDITRLQAGNVLPFGTEIVAYRFNGKRLKQLLEDGRANPLGYLQTSRLTMILKDEHIQQLYYTHDGMQIEILDDTPCVVTLDAFITDGGDGYNPDLFQGYEIEEFNQLNLISTEVFMDYLKSLQDPITVASTPMPRISK